MRLFVPLACLLLLSACGSPADVVGSPFDGFGGFVSDTVSFRLNPNRPADESVNIRRVLGQDVPSDPVLPEEGNIWPSLPRPEPTMQNIERPPPMAATPR